MSTDFELLFSMVTRIVELHHCKDNIVAPVRVAPGSGRSDDPILISPKAIYVSRARVEESAIPRCRHFISLGTLWDPSALLGSSLSIIKEGAYVAYLGDLNPLDIIIGERLKRLVEAHSGRFISLGINAELLGASRKLPSLSLLSHRDCPYSMPLSECDRLTLALDGVQNLVSTITGASCLTLLNKGRKVDIEAVV